MVSEASYRSGGTRAEVEGMQRGVYWACGFFTCGFLFNFLADHKKKALHHLHSARLATKKLFSSLLAACRDEPQNPEQR